MEDRVNEHSRQRWAARDSLRLSKALWRQSFRRASRVISWTKLIRNHNWADSSSANSGLKRNLRQNGSCADHTVSYEAGVAASTVVVPAINASLRAAPNVDAVIISSRLTHSNGWWEPNGRVWVTITAVATLIANYAVLIRRRRLHWRRNGISQTSWGKEVGDYARSVPEAAVRNARQEQEENGREESNWRLERVETERDCIAPVKQCSNRKGGKRRS